MAHVYVEGIEREVTQEYAEKRVAAGEWFACISTGHNLRGKYDPEDTVIYHRCVVPMKAKREASK